MPEPQILVQDIPNHREPRMYAARIFKSAAGNPFDNKLVSASTITHVGEKKVVFPVPSHAALCLNLANQAHKRAEDLWNSDIFATTSYGAAVEDNLPVLFDFFEQVILNVVFSHTALEAFCNGAIPDDFVFARTRQDKKCEESYTKEQIERHLSLDTKLAEVLPEVTGTAFQKGTSLWTDYAGLREIRDRIIHVKSADMGTEIGEGRSIWADLIKRGKIDSSLVAHKIIKHFPLKLDDSTPVASGRNQWVKLFPFKIL